MAPNLTATDLYVTKTLKTFATPKLHRPSCKRINASALDTVGDLLAANRPAQLVDAVAASCCKPSGDLAAEVRRLAAAQVEDASEEFAPVAAEEPAPAAEEPAEEDPADETPEAQDDPTDEAEPATPTSTQNIAFAATRMAKHYRSRFGRVGGKLITDALGVDAKITNSVATIKGEPEAVEHAVRVLYKTWDDGYDAFLAWRKGSAEYKAALASEKGSPWFKSARAALELQWLEDFCLGIAATLRDQELEEPSDMELGGKQSEGFAHGVAFATRSFLL